MIYVTIFGSVYFFLPLSFGKTKYGLETLFRIIRSSRGLRVTIPVPRGRKFKPAIYSSKEDLPADYSPRTAILGRFMYSLRLKSRSLSMRDIIERMF